MIKIQTDIKNMGKVDLYRSAAGFFTLGLVAVVTFESGYLVATTLHKQPSPWFGLAFLFSVMGITCCFGSAAYLVIRGLRTRPDSKIFGESNDI